MSSCFFESLHEIESDSNHCFNSLAVSRTEVNDSEILNSIQESTRGLLRCIFASLGLKSIWNPATYSKRKGYAKFRLFTCFLFGGFFLLLWYFSLFIYCLEINLFFTSHSERKLYLFIISSPKIYFPSLSFLSLLSCKTSAFHRLAFMH